MPLPPFITAPRLAACLLLLTMSIASAQQQQKKPRAPRMLEVERYEDAPALVYRTDYSPRRVSQHGNFTSYQVILGAAGANNLGDAGNDPSITIDPADPKKIAIGWRQFNTVSS